MQVDLFDFELPDTAIALRPANPRDSSRMLVVDERGQIADHSFLELTKFLREGDCLVFNDTKVIPARLNGKRTRDGNVAGVELTLHQRLGANRWAAFARGAKKLKPGDEISFSQDFSCTVAAKGEGGEVILDFPVADGALNDAISANGEMPLPPYIASQRGEDDRDETDYQTVYAAHEGAVAAPTAGLHFTDRVFADIARKNIATHFVTLHVGAGTFLPVKTDDTNDHKMHSENGEISPATAEALNAVRKNGGRIVAVGTTSLRLLESATNDDGSFSAWNGSTDIFITPGYQFKAVDILLTNFHLPKSTLFMLVSAFTSRETMQETYAHAIANDYRFYSYGDCNLLFRKPSQ